MIGAILLTVLAVALAALDWFASVPAEGAPSWPGWAKLACALVIALVGLARVFEGLVARYRGIESYKDGNYSKAIEHLETAINSPFKIFGSSCDRQSLDFLSLAWKKQAEKAKIPVVQDKNYLMAIDHLIQSINQYPQFPLAHNNLVNVLRRTCRWEEAKEAVHQLIDLLEGGHFTVPEKSLATYYMTIGNFYVDDDNPEFP